MRAAKQVFQPFLLKGFVLFAILGAGFVQRTSPHTFRPESTIANKEILPATQPTSEFQTASVIEVGHYNQR